jgi:predicted TIM-barrel fold metal-dependent hydrolase
MSTPEEPRQLSLSDLTIVDADSHVNESMDELLPYIERDNKGVRRNITGAVDPARDVYSTFRATPAFNQTRTEGGEYGDGMVHAKVDDPDQKRELMREFDIDYTVLTPGKILNLASVNHDQTAVALADAYNNWVVDTFLDAGEDGFNATLLVPHQAPDKAAEAIDRHADKDGIVGVQLPGSGLVPPAGHRQYEPIYEAAQDHGLPVVTHSGNSGAWGAFPVQRYWSETFLEDHAFTFPVESMWHLNSLVCRGVPERYPDLEFVFQEGGVEWVPWLMWRLDDHYLQNSQDVPILTRLPSEYIKDNFYFTTQPLGHTDNQQHLGWALDMAGGDDTVLFATDHPHPDFDPPSELFEPLKTHFDDDEIRGMMGETALDVFDLR